MAALSYGLNLTKKKPQPGAITPAKRKPIFDDDDDGDDGPDAASLATAITSFDGLPSTSPHPPTTQLPSSKPSKLPPKPYASLSAQHSTAQHDRTATALDASIYDYDAFHSTAAAASKPSNEPPGPKKPKYMAALLASAETRKRDALIAKERLLVKEREAEGDEFADKEKFVTAAYKAQQEEVRKLEAEEKVREEQEAEKRRKGGGGMTGFYKSVLDRDERRHAEVVSATAAAVANATGGDGKAGRSAGGDEEEDEERREKSEAELAREKGAAVNDEGVVVDKRQLLSAGLNRVAAPKAAVKATGTGAGVGGTGIGGVGAGLQGKAAVQRAQRERQTRMMEEQLEKSTREAREEDERQRAELLEKTKSKKSEGEIEGARERYLRRKREREEEAKGGKE